MDIEALSPKELFFDRELSWLDFNARVLEEAKNTVHPLLERLKFLAIFSSNLDEFFMIHIPGMLERSAEENGAMDERSVSARLETIQAKIIPLLKTQYKCYAEIMKMLAKHGVRVVPYSDLHPAQKERLRQRFLADILPLLTPMAVDPVHDFFVSAQLPRPCQYRRGQVADVERSQFQQHRLQHCRQRVLHWLLRV